jgi:hypothetical protein
MEKGYNLYNLEPQFREFLIAENISPISLKNYLSDLRYFFGWMSSKSLNVEAIDKELVEDYRKYLLDNNLPHKTVNRRLSTLRKFCSFCISQGWMDENPAKKIANITNTPIPEVPTLDVNVAPESPNYIKSFIMSISDKFKTKAKPETETKEKTVTSLKPERNLNFGLQHYIGFLIVLVFMAVLGAGIYNQFFSKTSATLAYPTTLKRAGRILSFQGRLTDSLGNPITTATNVTFNLYNVATGGTPIYTAGACSITPDPDGIINALIGGVGYSPTPPSSTYNVLCGAEIDSEIFTENANVYMGVTVASDSEMTPRQQIANVGYAINAETLQGFPPGTGTSSIPYINSEGDVLIAAANPEINSSYASSTFTISSANATTIQSAGAGDITLQATESGAISLRTGGDTSTFTRLFVDTAANGGNVGIGTTAPTDKLAVIGSASTHASYGGTAYRIASFNDGTNDNFLYLENVDVGGIETGVLRSGLSNSGQLGFATRTGSTNSMRLLIDNSGNVGIGDLTPLAALTVGNGDLFQVDGSTGSITTAGDIAVNGGDITSTSTTLNVTAGNTGTTNFILGSDILAAIKDQGTYGFWNLAGKSDTGDPATCAEGDIYYNAFDDTIKICHSGNTWEELDGGGSGSSVWSDLLSPTANLLLNMGTYKSEFNYDTGTGTDNLFSLTTDASSNGTGYLMNLETGTSSTVKPLRVSAGGVESLNVAANGNVGIGDTTPASLFTVGNGDLFRIDSTGRIITVDGVAHTIDDVAGNLALTSASTQISLNDNVVTTGTLTLPNANTLTGVASYVQFNNGISVGGGTTYNFSSTGDLRANSVYTGGTERINSGGNLVNIGSTEFNGVTYTWPNPDGTSGSVLTTNGTGGLSWYDLGSDGNLGAWTVNTTDGTIYPDNSTLDLFIGGTASASAKFAFLNVNSGDPTASISGNLAITAPTGADPATSFDILNGGTLNFRNSVGGNAGLVSRFYIDSNGNIGIGTTSPTEKLSLQQDNAGNLLGIRDGANNTSLLLADGGETTFKPTAFDYVYTFDGVSTYADNGTEAKSSGGTVFDILALENPSDDLFYVGLDHPFETIFFDIVTAGAGVTLTAEYFNGSGWSVLSTTDNTSALTTDGTITFSAPANWTTNSVNGQTEYWVRLISTTQVTTAPTAYSVSPTTGDRFSVFAQSGDSTNPSLYVNDVGNVGVGTNTPSTKLSIGGSTSSISNDSGDITIDAASGNIAFNGDNLINFSQALASLGSDSAPSFSFNGDGDTGFYSPAANTLAFSTNGSEKARIDTNGNMGIGTNAPGSRLEIKGTGATSATAALNVTNSTTTSLLYVRDDGNVGIGTTAPTGKLTIIGNDGSNLGLNNYAYSDTSWNSPYHLNYRARGTSVTPTAVQASDALTIFAGRGYDGTVFSNTDNAAMDFYANENFSGTNRGTYIRFRTTPNGSTSALERLRIANDGNIGIGTTGPDRKLDVLDASNPQLRLTQTDGTTYADVQVDSNGDLIMNVDGVTNQLVLDNSGNVGIGTAAPNSSYKLHVAGNLLADAFYDTTSPGTWFLNPAGASVLGGNISMVGDLYMQDGSPLISSLNSGSYNTITIKGSNDGTTPSLCVEGTGTGSTCDGKINAGTIDPPYTINGKKYATYISSMTGIKEETVGSVTTSERVDGVGYRKVIDFNRQVDGSDLWLFNKTSKLRENIKDMVVLLTPSDNTRTWFNIDRNNLTLTIYSSKPTVVSYRLTAPRFDAPKWKNIREDDDPVSGFILTDQGDVYGQAPANVAAASLSNTNVVYNGNLQDFKNTNAAFAVTGEYVDEFISASSALLGKIKAGFIEAQNVIVNNTLVANRIVTQTLDAATLNIRNLVVQEKISSPIIETNNIVVSETAKANKVETNEIKPKEEDIIFDLSQNNNPDAGKLAQLIIKGLEGKTVTTIDSQGNASFSGQVIADSLSIDNNATISGTLTAGQFETNEASVSGKLTAKEIQSDNLTDLENRLNRTASDSSYLATSVNDIQRLLAEIQNEPTPDPETQTNLSNTTDLTSMTLEELNVTGTTNVYNLSVSNSISTGNLLIEDNKILALSWDLNISALSRINFFDGAVTMARDGTITTRGEIIAEGGIRTNEIKGLTEEDNVNINKLAVDSLTINDKYLEATSSSAVIAAADNFELNGLFAPAIETATTSAGIAILPANSTEVVIYNNNIKEDSLVYLTPTSDYPQSGQLTVVKKEFEGKSYFKVSSNTISALPVKFNWLIVN